MKIIKRLAACRNDNKKEFEEYVTCLLNEKAVKELDNCKQHFKYSRLRHSLNVSYYSFLLAKAFDLDSRSVARAGLLHDLFFQNEGQNSTSLIFSHPKIALENAKKICQLNKMEEDIILKHMRLMTPHMPSYRESFLVSFVDKFCAIQEFVVSVFSRKKQIKVYSE